MIDFSERLQAAMKAASVSTSQLAEGLGVSYQAVKRVEEGRSKAFNAANNSKAAAFLGVSAHWLATGLGPMRDPSHPTEPLQRTEIPSVPLSEDILFMFRQASRDEIELAEDVLRQILGRSRRNKKPTDKSLLQKLDREHHDGISGEDNDAPGRVHRKRA